MAARWQSKFEIWLGQNGQCRHEVIHVDTATSWCLISIFKILVLMVFRLLRWARLVCILEFYAKALNRTFRSVAQSLVALGFLKVWAGSFQSLFPLLIRWVGWWLIRVKSFVDLLHFQKLSGLHCEYSPLRIVVGTRRWRVLQIYNLTVFLR